MRFRSFFLIMSAVGLVVGLGAGAAYAYFTSTGHGTGSASAGTMQTVTIAAVTVPPGTALVPGGTGDVTLKVTNPNGYAVTLVSVTGTGATITPDSGHPGCTTTGVTFTNQTGLSTTIPASSTATIDLPGAATMSVASSAGCQGATFSIPVTITVHKG
jgi:predicted ribosomally synthesized peptide with SipW-like signal peptide